MFLATDQYGNQTIIYVDKVTHRVLKDRFDSGHVQATYVDGKDSKTYQVGYVVGQGHGNQPLWLSIAELAPMWKEVS